MKNEFKSVMSHKTDQELIQIVTADKEKYQPLAFEAADAEIKARNIDKATFDTIKENISKREVKTIEAESNTVGSFTRFINYFIDLIIYYFSVALTNSLLVSLSPPEYNKTTTLLSFFIIIGAYFGYYYIMESKYQKTLGKFLTKTKVVHLDGSQPSLKEIKIRTLCRFIPFDNVSFLFTKKGFHDRFSGTIVVYEDDSNT